MKARIVLKPSPQVMASLRTLLGEGFHGTTIEEVAQRIIDDHVRKEIGTRPVALPKQEPQAPLGHPRTWSRVQWLQLVGQCRTRKQLGTLTHLDEKTVKRYLRWLDIKAPWERVGRPIVASGPTSTDKRHA